MDKHFMERLDGIRLTFNLPMRISSGYRCPKYNQAISETGETGPHTTGRAVDVRVSGREAFQLLDIAVTMGMTGIGIKQHGPHALRYLHLDDLQHEGRPWLWSYS